VVDKSPFANSLRLGILREFNDICGAYSEPSPQKLAVLRGDQVLIPCRPGAGNFRSEAGIRYRVSRLWVSEEARTLPSTHRGGWTRISLGFEACVGGDRLIRQLIAEIRRAGAARTN
jgi:hypothetical protein